MESIDSKQPQESAKKPLLVDSDIDAILGEGGVFSSRLQDFKARPGQLEMATEVLAAMRQQQGLIVEAGTGTGKTYAYLVPALLAGGKVIVSTGTRTLQDQLFHRDLPTVKKLLAIPVETALLKGRANYVCHHHLKIARLEGRFASREDAKYLKEIERFAATSATGDRSELSGVPETAGVWAQVASTRENCLGQDCEFHSECFVLAARRRAQQADIVVVNHHLFFADVMLKDEGAGELLPNCQAVIFDEAHQLPEIASLFFGNSLSTAQILDLCRDTRAEGRTLAAFPDEVEAALDRLEKASRELRLVFREREGRQAYEGLSDQESFKAALTQLDEALEACSQWLKELAGRSEGMALCASRAEEIRAYIALWDSQSQEGLNHASVKWIELFQTAVHLNATPLSVAEPFRKQLALPNKAWIFTSATLSVAGDFQHYQTQMGLDDVKTGRWESPFDYQEQALLYVPDGLPAPNTPGYTEAVVKVGLSLILASQGRSFFLFTSLRALSEAQTLLRQAFDVQGVQLPLLVQGQASRGELLTRFRSLGNAVLLGSQSFWEGVDVKGEALSLVIIDKLPFAAPDDPVLAARIAEIERRGGNGFMDHQLPLAVINLKQGAGRLIRDETDQGVLAICDPRLISKPYGKKIWRSLPPMKRTRDQSVAEAFLKTLRRPSDPPF
jgi:ATP-dependent DNA helicase DinG